MRNGNWLESVMRTRRVTLVAGLTISVMVLSICLLPNQAAASSLVVYDGAVTTVTDTSQLNTVGNFAYAIDIHGATVMVNGLTFLDSDNPITGYSTNQDGGYGFSAPTIAGTDAANAKTIFQVGNYSDSGVLTVTLAASVGREYTLQLFFWEPSESGRADDIAVNGTTVVTGLDPYDAVNPTNPLVYTYTFTNTVNPVVIALTGSGSGVPILAGLSLETLPEPASVSLLGVGSLLILRRRRA